NGTVNLTSNDPAANDLGSVTLSGGGASINATLFTAASITLTASDGSISGNTAITVNPAAATPLQVNPVNSPIAGPSSIFTVLAEAAYSNVDTNYSGTVTFSSSDGSASLPPDSTLTNGFATFSAIFNTTGTQTLTATDTGNSSITGSITVNVASAAVGIGATG